MTYRIERTDTARGDLLDIWLTIALDDPDAADRQLRRLDEAIAGLAAFPRLGPARDDIRPGIRAILRVPFLAFYTVDDDARIVRIVRVVDARRDLMALFRQ
ncbi:type II toxin-antitoxin system RelE/ParE family toxin [Novosphingobium sp.]|uniref:type II toxin-antitoxin system RelE/ParE family toxin n=1 Tax=Novosphingobium sp. TaxID=1874826 RepID=UPI001E168F14|nr:type II toxin-antitoxin system RelE/ParE family toxin [Novosphingobium sp.]MBX9662781.1 type II toxin-antitoxin system RelE/ParE family toxin [Novosphingobium sp.]